MSQCQPYATMQHCGHAAVFGRRHLARSALRPCPTACMRERLHRCVRWEDKEVAGRLQRAAISYSLSTLREKGEEEKRGEEKGGLYGDVYRTPELLKISHVLLTFGNSNYGNTPVAAAFRPTKLRAWPSVCVMLHDNLFLTDIKWPRSKFYAKWKIARSAIVACTVYAGLTRARWSPFYGIFERSLDNGILRSDAISAPRRQI